MRNYTTFYPDRAFAGTRCLVTVQAELIYRPTPKRLQQLCHEAGRYDGGEAAYMVGGSGGQKL
jgi:hypothetical protein